MQIPVSVGVFSYEILGLYKGRRVISSRGDQGRNWVAYKLVLCAASGLVAGIIGGLLGIGGGFVIGPVFLELGIPPQVFHIFMFTYILAIVDPILIHLIIRGKIYTYI